MSKIYGRGQTEQVLICEEQGDYGDIGTNTFLANGYHAGYDVELDPSGFDPNSFVKIYNDGSDSLAVKKFVKGTKKFGFTLKFKNYNWWFLKYSMFNQVTNVDQTTYFEHTWTPTKIIKAFQVEWLRRQDTNQIIQLKGCIIKNWRIVFNKSTSDSDTGVNIELDCIAQDIEIIGSATTLASPTKDPYKFYQAKLTYEGNEYAELNSGTINADQSINEDNSLYCNATFDGLIGEPIAVKQDYSLEVNVNQFDNTFLSDFVNGDELTGVTKLEFISDTHDSITFLNSNAVLFSGLSATQQGVNNANVLITPKTLDITGEDNEQY